MNEKVAPRGVTDPNGFESIPGFLQRPPASEHGAEAPASDATEPHASDGVDNHPYAGRDGDQGDEDHVPWDDLAIGTSLTVSDAALPHLSPGETPSIVPQNGDEFRAAEELAGEVVMCLRTVNGAVIQAGRLVHEAVTRLRGDRAAFSRFIDVLVEHNVLDKSQAQLRERAPKLSMLSKIGRYADLLEREDIGGKLPDGLTVLYQAANLLEANAGDENAQTEKLVEQIREGEAAGEMSRAYLERLTKEAKQAAKPKKPTLVTDNAPEVKLHAGLFEPFDVFLLTPSEEDISRLDQDAANEASLPVCRRLDEMAADEAVSLSIVPFSAVPTLVKRVLDESGFRVSKTYLLQRPTHADITDVRVLMVAERGKNAAIQMPDGDWLPEDLVGDPLALAEHLVPDARSKVHVFGEHAWDGWDALVGERNWAMGGDK